MKSPRHVYTAAGLLLLLATALFSACASTGGRSGKNGGNPYYDDNIADFSAGALSNGIPVIYKQQQGKTAWLGLVIDGGVAFYPPEKSGLEEITLSLMLHGSQAYPYSEIQRLQFEKSFSLSSSAGKDYSVISSRFINRDLESAVSMLADSLLHPLLTPEDFATVMTEEAESIQRTLSNPSGVLGLELAKSAYQGHTYATSVSPTASTISLISLDDVQAHYQTLLNSARLAFVVVGDFKGKEQKKLTEMLESYFGNLEDKGFEKATIAPLEASAGADYASCEVAADTGYIAGYFACPERTSDEYVAFAIALMYLDDIMFKQVREEHGAVYSIGSGVFGGKQLLGALSVYKATEKKQLKSYILEAIESFPDSQGIADQLDRYKNKYITSLFESSQSTGGVAGNIVASLAYYGSPMQYLNRAAQVQAVTAEDVALVYSRFLAQSKERAENQQPNPIHWVVVSGEEALRDFSFD